MENLLALTKFRKQGLNLMSISRKIKKNEIGNLGFGFYCSNPNLLILEKDLISRKINRLLDGFGFKPERVVFSSISLNFCINQLISSNTYIVEVEKEYIEATFTLLKEKFGDLVLFKPSDNDKALYWEQNKIYVVELFKRSPVNKDGTMTIEKLIVDLLFDKNLSSLYSGKDIESAIEVLCTKYCINYKTLFAYAKRRNRGKELYSYISKYIPSQILELIKI